MSFRDDGLEIVQREMGKLRDKRDLGTEDIKMLTALVEAYLKLCVAQAGPPSKGKQNRVLTFKRTKNASLISQLKAGNH